MSKYKDLTPIDCLSEDINTLLNIDSNLPFKELLVNTLMKLSRWKFVDGDAIEEEINNMKVDVIIEKNTEYDIENYSKILDDINIYRSRLIPLLSKVQADYLFIEKTFDALYKAWIARFSSLSSDKKREGEAEYVLMFMLDYRIKRENYFNLVKNAITNMNSKMEVISRKITIVQEIHKLIGYTNTEPRPAKIQQRKTETVIYQKNEEEPKSKKDFDWDDI